MPEDDGRWWDTMPKEAVEELHIRQHPYHSAKKPRYECPLCWEQFTARLKVITEGYKPKPNTYLPSTEPRSTYQPPLKRLKNALKYWDENLE